MLEKIDMLISLVPDPVAGWLKMGRGLLDDVQIKPDGDWLVALLGALPMLSEILRPFLVRMLQNPDELVSLLERLQPTALSLFERFEGLEISDAQLQRWLTWLSGQIVGFFEGSIASLDRDQLDRIIGELERFMHFVAVEASARGGDSPM